MTQEPTIISITHHGNKFEAQLNWDASLEDVFSSLRGLLLSAGWSINTIDEFIRLDEDLVEGELIGRERVDFVDLIFTGVQTFYKLSEEQADEICQKASDEELNILIASFNKMEISEEANRVIKKYTQND